MSPYRERLWPAPWIYISTALVIPASILVLAPISWVAGVITAVILYGGMTTMFIVGAPTISVGDGELRAGRARISLDLVGTPKAFTGTEAALQRGRKLDARAYMLFRGWISGVVRIPVLDENDPTPYWLVSTREPEKLAAAIEGSRRPESV